MRSFSATSVLLSLSFLARTRRFLQTSLRRCHSESAIWNRLLVAAPTRAVLSVVDLVD